MAIKKLKTEIAEKDKRNSSLEKKINSSLIKCSKYKQKFGTGKRDQNQKLN